MQKQNIKIILHEKRRRQFKLKLKKMELHLLLFDLTEEMCIWLNLQGYKSVEGVISFQFFCLMTKVISFISQLTFKRYHRGLAAQWQDSKGLQVFFVLRSHGLVWYIQVRRFSFRITKLYFENGKNANACNSQKEAWLTPQKIFILGQDHYPSQLSHVRLFV